MVYQGHVENGAVVLDDAAALPDGTRVEIRIVSVTAAEGNVPKAKKPEPPWLKHFGCITDLPADASEKVDEVLYGRGAE